MAKWKHRCDFGWLQTRQRYLTATDVKKLLPVTKTGRPRKIGNEDYLEIMAGKCMRLDESDCESFGAAARGHVLEPYAIDMFNKMHCSPYTLHHWDDSVVCRPTAPRFSLAFSPDAMSFEQAPDTVPIAYMPSSPQAIQIGEVKSYSPERHLACGYTLAMKLEERWQIATAMAVLDEIEAGYLIFYNPSMHQQLFVATYWRSDLSEEIDMVKEVEKGWLDWTENVYPNMIHCKMCCDYDTNEQDIIEQIMEREKLNPEDEWTVRQ